MRNSHFTTVQNLHSAFHALLTHPVHNLKVLQRKLQSMMNPGRNENHPPGRFCPSFQLHTTPQKITIANPKSPASPGFFILLTIRAGQSAAELYPAPCLIFSTPHLSQYEYVEGKVHKPAGTAVRQDYSAIHPDPGGHHNHQFVCGTPGSQHCPIGSTSLPIRSYSVFSNRHFYCLHCLCVSVRLHC